jgi:hypothetical protein
VHSSPSWIFEGHETIVGVDIGGTNIRAGLVSLKPREGGPTCPKPRSRRPSAGGMATRRSNATKRSMDDRDAEGADRARAERKGLGLAPFNRHRVSGPGFLPDGLDRAWCTEPSRQLGEFAPSTYRRPSVRRFRRIGDSRHTVVRPCTTDAVDC